MAFITVTVVSLPSHAEATHCFAGAERVVDVATGQELPFVEGATGYTFADGVEEGKTYEVHLSNPDPLYNGPSSTRIRAEFGHDWDLTTPAVFHVESANTVGQQNFIALFSHEMGLGVIDNLQEAVEMLNTCSAYPTGTSSMFAEQTKDWPNLDLSSLKMPNVATEGEANLFNPKGDDTSGVTMPQFGVECDGSEPQGPDSTPPDDSYIKAGDLMVIARGGISYQADVKSVLAEASPSLPITIGSDEPNGVPNGHLWVDTNDCPPSLKVFSDCLDGEGNPIGGWTEIIGGNGGDGSGNGGNGGDGGGGDGIDADGCSLMEAKELFWGNKDDGTISYDGAGAFNVTIPADTKNGAGNSLLDRFTVKLVNIPEGSVCAIPLYNSDDQGNNSLTSNTDGASAMSPIEKSIYLQVNSKSIAGFKHDDNWSYIGTDKRNYAFTYSSDLEGPISFEYSVSGRNSTAMSGSVNAPLFVQPSGVDVSIRASGTQNNNGLEIVAEWAAEPDRNKGDVLIWYERAHETNSWLCRHHDGGSIFIWEDATHVKGVDGTPVEIIVDAVSDVEDNFIQEGSFVFSEKGLTQAGWTKVENWLRNCPMYLGPKSDPLFELMADSQSHKIEMHGLDEYQAMIAELQDVGASEEEIFAALAVLSRVNGFRYTQGLLKFEGLSPDGRYCMSPGVVRAGDTETDSIFMGNSAYHVAGLLYAESKDNLKDCGGIKGYSGTGGKVESWQFGLTSKDRTPVLHMAAPLIFELAAAVEEGEIPYYINQNPKVYEIDESLEISDADFKAATGVDLFIDLPSGDSGYLANVGVQVSGVPAGTWNFYGGSDFARWTYAYVDNNMVIQEWSSNNINHDTVAEHVAAWPAVSEVTDWSLAYNEG